MSAVTLCECFARDGLQHEPAFVPTATKRALIERFAALGFRRIEATSYSNPKVVPQFADASELLESLPRREGTFYKATCANPRAVERALAALAVGEAEREALQIKAADEDAAEVARSKLEDKAGLIKGESKTVDKLKGLFKK